MIYDNKYGFVYIWFDRKHKRYYIGCRWGNINDNYICSSAWMKQAWRIRPEDFKRRILQTNIASRRETYEAEQNWLDLIKEEEIKPNNSNPRYYNLCITNNEVWHKYDEKIKTVGEKISKAKKGKRLGPMSDETKAKISKANSGKKRTPEQIAILSKIKTGTKHTNEWKQANSERLKRQWADGTRKRADPKKTMTRVEQDKKHSNNMKQLWANSEWAANQRKRLAEGAKNRPPRSEESKRKTSLAQIGKPKKRTAVKVDLSINSTNNN